MNSDREYFTIKLTAQINLGVALADLVTVVQFATKVICAVPGVAEFWYGVVNYKGSLLWVLDSDRFFELDDNRKLGQKLTAIVVRDRSGNHKQVALVTSQLKGIVAVAPTEIESLADNETTLHQCCSAVVPTNAIYLLDSALLLQQLHQRSTLVAT